MQLYVFIVFFVFKEKLGSMRLAIKSRLFQWPQEIQPTVNPKVCGSYTEESKVQ